MHEQSETLWRNESIKKEFKDIVYDFDCLPLGILLREEEDFGIKELEPLLNLCDGLIFQGGMITRDNEIELCKYAIEKDIPLIGICAGFNVLLQAVDGEIVDVSELGLDKSLHNVYDAAYRHEISLVNDLKEWFGSDKIAVNSFHNRFMIKENEKVIAQAFAYNGAIQSIEAFKLKDKKFAYGIKWHPEIMEKEHLIKCFKPFFKVL